MSVMIDVTDVAGVIKAFRIDRQCGPGGVIEVALHHVLSANQHFPVALRDLHLNAFERGAYGADLIVFGPVRTGDARLGHSVALQNWDTRGPKGVREFPRERCTAGYEKSNTAAHAVPPF